jgi:ubiquinone biosynthesis protein COQ9
MMEVSGMFDTTTEKGRVMDAALRLAAERPWNEVTLRDIAEAAGTDLVAMRRSFSSPNAIVAEFIRAVDDDIIGRAPKASPDQPRRDVLFDIIMSRFDALAPHKAAVKSISAATSLDPRIARALFSSQNWMLQAAGVRTDGIDGGVKVAGLAAIYASAFRTWLSDDDPGLGRTMAVLDRGLRRAERTWRSVSHGLDTLGRVVSAFKPRASSEKADAGPAPTATQPEAGPNPAAESGSQRQADDGSEPAH